MDVNAYPSHFFKKNKREKLYFGGTDYLGMQSNDEFVKIVQHNIKYWGTSYGSSRNANIKLSIYDEFETHFANFLEFESVISISSGTLAGFLVKEVLSKPNIKAFHITKSHPAVVFKNSKPVFVNGVLDAILLNDVKEDIIISSDAIIALQTEVTNFDFLNKIHPNKRVTLIIDESHSLGILGPNGCGISTAINNPIIKRKILISSLSKAYAVSGGIIASDTKFIDAIKKHSSFIGAAGVNPAFLQSVIDAEVLYQRYFNKLKKNLAYLYAKLPKNTDFIFSKEYPIIYYPKIYKELFIKNNIITTNFIYHKNQVNRIVLKASFDFNDLDILLTILHKKIPN